MNSDNPASDVGLSTREREQIDEVRSRFQNAWVAGQSPRIEQFMDEVAGPARLPLLFELLKIELDLRSRRGERPTRREYLDRFPAAADLVESGFASTHPDDRPSTIDFSPGVGDGQASAVRRSFDRAPAAQVRADRGAPSGAGATASRPDATTSFQAVELAPTGRRIGRFTIIRQLGEGGFGKVYLAWDEELGREVAIKVPRAGVLTTPREVESF